MASTRKVALSAKYSQIVGNQAKGTLGIGGGAIVRGQFSAANSTINGNIGTIVGGVSSYGASIVNSTISGNSASSDIGGLYVNTTGSQSSQITNSTISGNTSQTGSTGGVRARLSTTVQNSTIAFNTAATGLFEGTAGSYSAPGLAVLNPYVGSGKSIAVTLQSSIISNNTYGNTEVDFSTQDAISSDTINITSNNNIIRASLGPQRPATITTNCPLLGPLRSNGGPTQTHALLSRSPAIDTGNNSANLTGDQRGAAYPRVSGPSADIGAYEVQQADIIFNSSFEGCPILF